MFQSSKRFKLFILLMTLFCVEEFGLIECQNVVNNCTVAKTCSECIATWENCKWCADEQFNGASRCNTHHSNCANHFVVNPKSSKIVTNNLRKQLKPQKVEVELRAGSEETIDVTFKRSKDYPLDLYYLMDISCTMALHKNSLSSIGNQLAEKLKTTTKDFRIGFGSYVDKETTPFSDYTSHSQKQRRCNRTDLDRYGNVYNVDMVMADVHDFLNQMKLSSNTTKFKNEVEATKSSGNFDHPEGTLDALMQVMACGNEIGWRNDSDKIIVVATDAEFHYAGDGKLAGIVIPNDGKCHLDSTGRYIGSLKYDYPSLHHIAQMAKDKKFNIIFSIKHCSSSTSQCNEIKPQFEALTNLIGSNARITDLIENGTQITQLIENVYKKITTSVQLVIEEQPNNVQVEIWAKCPQFKEFKNYSSCRFSGKPEISFKLKIRLLNCTKVGVNTKNTIVIGLPNMNEKVEITLRELCQCDCETNLRQTQLNSRKCSLNGTFSCGICTECNGKRTGQMCECDPDHLDLSDPNKYCRKSGNDPHLCSGRGRCECQKCVCEGKWAGDHCDQDETECYDTNNVKCNNRGTCKSNQCDCSNSEYSGKYCECTLSNEKCITNHTSGQICNGLGECRCGKCECNKQATAFGDLCEKCPLCEAPIYCDQLLSCVPQFRDKFCLNSSQIAQNKSTNPCLFDSSSCEKIMQNLEYTFVETIFESKSSSEVQDPRSKSFPYQCRKVIDNCDVSYDFRLMYAQANWPNFTLTNYTLNCPQPVNLIKIGLGALLTVLLIGLITLVLWKLLTDYYDRREYERFTLEVDNAEFAENLNPLYKDVKLRVKNPLLARVRDRTTKFFSNVFVKRGSKMMQIPMSELSRSDN